MIEGNELRDEPRTAAGTTFPPSAEHGVITNTGRDDRGWLGRLLAVLRRCVLGRSAHDYWKQFTGSDAYWDRVLASERNGPPLEGAPARTAPVPEFEPVHGWTRRQLDEYLARNPAYRPAYEEACRGIATGRPDSAA